MKEIQIKSIDELQSHLKVTGQQYKLLRGHTNAFYKLKPGLTRGLTKPERAKILDRRLYENFRSDVDKAKLESHFNSVIFYYRNFLSIVIFI